MSTKILNEAEIRNCVSMEEEALKCIEMGFSALAEGRVVQPPILRVDIAENNGEVDVKTAYIKGSDFFAIKIASGFYNNICIGLPSGSGMILVINARTGIPEAVLLDNGYLTDVRTGLAGAIAAKYLAPRRVVTAGVIGSGSQARYQVRGLKMVRDFERLLVFGVKPEGVQQFAEEMSVELKVEVIPQSSPEEVVRKSQVVITSTPSRKPFLRGEWLHSGIHVTCMGSDAEEKQELYPDAFHYADLVACDYREQCFKIGELHHAKEAGVIGANNKVIELGDLTSGKLIGRQSEKEITICDLTGVGVQDTSIAMLAYRRAMDLSLGITLSD